MLDEIIEPVSRTPHLEIKPDRLVQVAAGFVNLLGGIGGNHHDGRVLCTPVRDQRRLATVDFTCRKADVRLLSSNWRLIAAGISDRLGRRGERDGCCGDGCRRT